jgi:hypothetical protein
MKINFLSTLLFIKFADFKNRKNEQSNTNKKITLQS